MQESRTKTLREGREASAEEREAMSRLRKIPNVGPKIAALLIKVGVRRLEDAASKDSYEMYHELCAIDAKRYDPCVRDTFAAVVAYADGGPARPWWEFTPERKEREAKGRGAKGREALDGTGKAGRRAG